MTLKPRTPGVVSSHQKLEEARKGSLRISEGHGPTDTLILDFPPLKPESNAFLLF